MVTMPRRFFQLSDDLHVPNRWHLNDPTDANGHEVEDPCQFRRGAPVEVTGRLKMPVEHAGMPLDYTLAGSRIPVVNVKAASVFSEMAPNDVQLIPIEIERMPEQYLILVATRLIQCIDEKASKISYWTAKDGAPAKNKKYFSISELRIDKSRVGDAKVFRPEGWAGTLIVSADIKIALGRIGATGTTFEEV